MHIRRLTPADAIAFQRLRLAALKDTPSAFACSYEEEKDLAACTVAGRLAEKAGCGSLGAFEGETLVGIVALGRESLRKLAHKAWIGGLYVQPQARGKGLARALLAEALSLARSVPQVKQVHLCVNAGNASAIHLYESVGFQAFGREPGALCVDGVLHDEIHMYLRPTDG